MIKKSIRGKITGSEIPMKEVYTNEELSKLVDLDYAWTQQNAATINANAEELQKLKSCVQFGFIAGCIAIGVKIYNHFKRKEEPTKDKKEESV